MKKNKTSGIFVSGIIFGLILAVFGCQTNERAGSSENDARNVSPSPSPIAAETVSSRKTKNFIDVLKFADKSSGEFDRAFGKPQEVKKIERGGEYRLYKTDEFPKGLAVRFYGGRARSFNLILDAPQPTAKEAILKSFGIDVGNAPPVKDKNEPLTERFAGTFGGVKFAKVAAKKNEKGGFTFVLAETAY